MRITFILASANLAGGTRVVLMIADRLRKRGHDILVVFPPPPHPTRLSRIKSLLCGNILRTPEPDLSYFDELRLNVKYRLLDRHRPVQDRDLPDADAVVATFWTTAEWVSRLSPSKGARVYFIQQYEANFGHATDRVDATWRLPMQKVVCSGWLANLAQQGFGDSSAVIVRNGIDTELFHAPPRGRQSRPTVGFLYAPTVPVKGTNTARKVLEIVRRRVPNLHVRAFGTGPLVPNSLLPPGSEYIQRPRQEELRTIYAGCDAWLCTSTSEGFHLPPHEAMACRCPVVSTPVGGPADLIIDGLNGYLAEVDDVDGLANRLTSVLTADDPSWRRMSDAAYATATRYTWDDATDLFEQALLSAVGNVSPSGRVP